LPAAGALASEGIAMLQGRCLCGAVAYRIHGPVSEIDLCHCTYCRRASGSAFAANASIARADFELLAGAEVLQEYESTPGKHRSFCSRCGSPVYARHVAAPELLRIRVGTIDGDPGSRPTGHCDVASKAPWYTITDDLPQSPD
jgi:hypothetical protein